MVQGRRSSSWTPAAALRRCGARWGLTVVGASCGPRCGGHPCSAAPPAASAAAVALGAAPGERSRFWGGRRHRPGHGNPRSPLDRDETRRKACPTASHHCLCRPGARRRSRPRGRSATLAGTRPRASSRTWSCSRRGRVTRPGPSRRSRRARRRSPRHRRRDGGPPTVVWARGAEPAQPSAGTGQAARVFIIFILFTVALICARSCLIVHLSLTSLPSRPSFTLLL